MKIARLSICTFLLVGLACSEGEQGVRWRVLAIEKVFSQTTGDVSLAVVGNGAWTSSISGPLTDEELREELGGQANETMTADSVIVDLAMSESQSRRFVYRFNFESRAILESVLIDKRSGEVTGRWDGIKQGCISDSFLFSEALNLYAWDGATQSGKLIQDGVSSVACSDGTAYFFKNSGDIVKLEGSTDKGEPVASFSGVVTESSALPDGTILFYNSRSEKHLGNLKMYDPVSGRTRLIGKKWPSAQLVVLGEAL
ncbi:MAG: hypothetical protein AAF481_00770 [Acidobacteriota bacterium]